MICSELRSVQESEELTVNTAATINNLSYYQQQSSALRNSHLAIAECKTKSSFVCTGYLVKKSTNDLCKINSFVFCCCCCGLSDDEVVTQLQYGRSA